AFDDFARQPLLPRQLSHAGPAVAWADLDGDGHDELVIGGGRGNLAVARFARGKFEPLASLGIRTSDDLAGMTIWTSTNGHTSLLAGQSRLKPSDTNAPALVQI